MVTKGNNIYIFNGGGVCFFSGKGGREKKLMHDLNSRFKGSTTSFFSLLEKVH